MKKIKRKEIENRLSEIIESLQTIHNKEHILGTMHSDGSITYKRVEREKYLEYIASITEESLEELFYDMTGVDFMEQG